MPGKCSAPRGVSVSSYSRAKRRRKAKGPATYWVAANQHGHTCGHKHVGLFAASRCARTQERHYKAKYGSKSKMAGTWLAAKRTAR